MRDDIERWEWEGGAVTVEANGAPSVKDKPVPGWPTPGRPVEAPVSAFELDDLYRGIAV